MSFRLTIGKALQLLLGTLQRVVFDSRVAEDTRESSQSLFEPLDGWILARLTRVSNSQAPDGGGIQPMRDTENNNGQL